MIPKKATTGITMARKMNMATSTLGLMEPEMADSAVSFLANGPIRRGLGMSLIPVWNVVMKLPECVRSLMVSRRFFRGALFLDFRLDRLPRLD